ncbi:MAG TPA: DUF692 domain-containing protein [Gammaproteobacteria bacterium]|nr:DUF692 domain-containing protein [Gammaproteobacteria bacterium]
MPHYQVSGAGLGLKQEILPELLEQQPAEIGFVEVAPENWIGVGGARRKALDQALERYPLVCHGLSLDIGGPRPLDPDFLARLRRFLDDTGALIYTEHLSYCGDSGQLYDLMPIPFTEEAVHYVAGRIRQVQDALGRRIGMENVSTYALPAGEMSEIEFLNAVVEEADCGYHLDINNIFVNAMNHGFDPQDYLARIPAERILYAHIAGHYVQAPDLRIDTHGEPVISEVWAMLDQAYDRYGVFPPLLERDFNIPPLAELRQEIAQILAAQERHREQADEHVA